MARDAGLVVDQRGVEDKGILGGRKEEAVMVGPGRAVELRAREVVRIVRSGHAGKRLGCYVGRQDHHPSLV